jgi:pyruvyl transferase EpsO
MDNKISFPNNGYYEPIVTTINGHSTVYLDLPLYINIGDLLIMFGTLEFFKKNRVLCTHKSTAHNFSPNAISGDTVILLQGGGNFGDLYEIHQNFRRMIVEQFPDNRIILLPQSIYYKSKDRYKDDCIHFSKHADFHIFTRDKNSLSLAQGLSKHSYLAPDMAHHLYPIKPTTKPSKKVLAIKRVDIEAVGKNSDGISQYDTVTDWPLLVGDAGKITVWRLYRYFELLSTYHLLWLGGALGLNIWLWCAKKMVDQAIRLYSEHEYIVTDRLHGHILASLMDKPNTVYDNSYGKNSSYVKEWTLQSDKVVLKNE